MQAIGREITGAHIHIGAAGVAGAVVVDLDPFGADVTGNKATHCVRTSPATAAAIIANPSGYYVNVHTTDYPAGVFRASSATERWPAPTHRARCIAPGSGTLVAPVFAREVWSAIGLGSSA